MPGQRLLGPVAVNEISPRKNLPAQGFPSFIAMCPNEEQVGRANKRTKGRHGPAFNLGERDFPKASRNVVDGARPPPRALSLHLVAVWIQNLRRRARSVACPGPLRLKITNRGKCVAGRRRDLPDALAWAWVITARESAARGRRRRPVKARCGEIFQERFLRTRHRAIRLRGRTLALRLALVDIQVRTTRLGPGNRQRMPPAGVHRGRPALQSAMVRRGSRDSGSTPMIRMRPGIPGSEGRAD